MNGRIIKINRTPVAIVGFIFLLCVGLYYLKSNVEMSDKKYVHYYSNKVSLRKLLIVSIQAAQLGGLEIIKVAENKNLKERSKGKTDEGANDPLTDADFQSHCVMKQGLQRHFPSLEIFSEEDKEICIANNAVIDLDPTVLHETVDVPEKLEYTKDITVWIDPLDATQEFTEQLYQYVTTMVCVAIRGKPVIGVIHRPFIGQTAWAWVNHSESEYLQSLRSGEHIKDMEPVITVSRSHAGNVVNLTHSVFGDSSKLLTAAGAGYKVLQVIANNASVYLHSTKIKKWDICAGHALLEAVDGKMTTLEGDNIEYGPKQSVVNDKGLLATLKNHESYIKKIEAYLRNQHTGNKYS